MVAIKAIEKLVQRMLAPVKRRAQLAVSRAIVNLIDDSTGVQTLQVDVHDGQTRSEVENFQPLGLSAVPSEDAEAVVVAVGGNQDHLIALGVNDRSVRPLSMDEGETKVYNAYDANVYLKADGSVVITDTDGSTITMASNNIVLSPVSETHCYGSPAAYLARADLVDLRLIALETWSQAIVQIYNKHYHKDGEGQDTGKALNKNITAEPPQVALTTFDSVACSNVKGT